MKKPAYDRNWNAPSYIESGAKSGLPILIQHGLIASINDQFVQTAGLKRSATDLDYPTGLRRVILYCMQNIAEWAEAEIIMVLPSGGSNDY